MFDRWLATHVADHRVLLDTYKSKDMQRDCQVSFTLSWSTTISRSLVRFTRCKVMDVELLEICFTKKKKAQSVFAQEERFVVVAIRFQKGVDKLSEVAFHGRWYSGEPVLNVNCSHFSIVSAVPSVLWHIRLDMRFAPQSVYRSKTHRQLSGHWSSIVESSVRTGSGMCSLMGIGNASRFDGAEEGAA